MDVLRQLQAEEEQQPCVPATSGVAERANLAALWAAAAPRIMSMDTDDNAPSDDLNSAQGGTPDRVDQYYDDRHVVPFHINEETFPVPTKMSDEPWCPGKPLRVAYVSWNMGHREACKEEVSLYCIRPNAHIIVVCTQENGDHLGLKGKQKRWTKFVGQTCLQNLYTLVGHKTLWCIQLLVYARQSDVAPYVQQTDASSVKTGIVNGLGGNKGGVAVALALSMSVSPLKVNPESLHKNTSFSMGQSPSAFSPREGPGASLDAKSDFGRAVTAPPYITLLFIGAHLAAHQKGVSLRNKDYHSIIRALQVGFCGRHKAFFEKLHSDSKSMTKHTNCDGAAGENGVGATYDKNGDVDDCNSSEDDSDVDDEYNLSVMQLPLAESQSGSESHRDVTEEFDLVFFGGDLNYRINGTRKAIEYIIKQHKDIRSILIHNDQLNLERAKGVVFHRFQEGKLLFRPTYKYEIDHDAYNFTKKKDRMPAYCDRVLYKTRLRSGSSRVKIRLYTDVQQVRTSDHRPVVAIFDVATQAYSMPEVKRASSI
ncbi:endonuclease/Exonuclease/phosphatase [Trypanosoma grayi]|uniref:endonuclease/Exonuclease/phosphatase n=1 Tax=Trypanosoma grayi TaxID=71804 RepID=UPI0004F48C5F|nr:endonuclease/Exonuclease/phosphatase [Trypanosoma grayi]KEG14985.1 endonuclease/Exonuclease/phosphatase [Trypanosoma grayi]